jgi:hypothetical protein
MGVDGCFCPICYCVWYPELVDDYDKIKSKEFEENGG